MATATAPKNRGKGKTKTERDQERQARIAARLDEAKQLVPSIKTAHQAVLEALESGLEHAIQAGGHLAAAKKLVGHGGWAEWVEEHCAFSYRTARSYLRVYTRRDQLPKREEISYRRALLMLRRDPAKKPGTKKKKVVRIIGLTDLKKLLQRHKIDTEVDELLPVLKELGIRVTTPRP
jgi:hypothetical protein